ncbi:MAG: type 1 glutamine amidotransferase [Candidatus Omnitrophota bacterium]
MKKIVLIVKNITREGPGIIENLLKERNINYTVIDLDKGETFPHPQDYSALVVMGGPDSANDHTPKMKSELQRIQEALSLNIPYLGICLGLQTLIKAAGGKVAKSPLKEVGFKGPDNKPFIISLTAAEKKDPLFKGLGDNFRVFQLHGETVELTPEMKLLGKGEFCQNQIIKVGSNAYGIQCHFELTPEMFEVWLNEDADLLRLNKKQLRDDFNSFLAEYTSTGQKLFQNFLEIAGL